MAKAERKAKMQKMASDLIARGYPHGKRASRPTHANYPKMGEVGSAAYRRLLAKKRKSNSEAAVEPMFDTKSAKRRGKNYKKAA